MSEYRCNWTKPMKFGLPPRTWIRALDTETGDWLTARRPKPHATL